ncbi:MULTISPECIES: hypothetical protein [unclassified Dysgonomonas]|uniref:hypothetical protein n=1 Tax=unclassified Dysgonomonas TaxID=2630389 RepID=UPI0025C18E23|nr:MULTISPECIES: hypothetical protein [unclassified Dysgonomonas]
MSANKSKEISILMTCIDRLAGMPVSNDENNIKVAKNITYNLKDLQKIDDNGNLITKVIIVFASISCDALKLSILGYMPYKDSFNLVEYCLESALSYLID